MVKIIAASSDVGKSKLSFTKRKENQIFARVGSSLEITFKERLGFVHAPLGVEENAFKLSWQFSQVYRYKGDPSRH